MTAPVVRGCRRVAGAVFGGAAHFNPNLVVGTMFPGLEETVMISENCSIDEFVDAVKDREVWEVVSLAVDEATQAERRYYHARRRHEAEIRCGHDYSAQLKRLIDYLRFAIKPRRPADQAYRLYIANWGPVDEDLPLPPDERPTTLQ